mmetsp:Transcript_19073/g.30323  ORF Transcript_19073/g.30323 Transcript_19073/m.30323 type:complete len:102 (+) Transcript_19073:944-1249(+)
MLPACAHTIHTQSTHAHKRIDRQTEEKKRKRASERERERERERKRKFSQRYIGIFDIIKNNYNHTSNATLVPLVCALCSPISLSNPESFHTNNCTSNMTNC